MDEEQCIKGAGSFGAFRRGEMVGWERDRLGCGSYPGQIQAWVPMPLYATTAY